MKNSSVYKDNIEVKYSSDGKYFYIDSPLCIDSHFSTTLKDGDKIKKYSLNNQDVVSILDMKKYNDSKNIERIIIKTEYLNDYFPMVVMKTNHNLYDNNEISLMNNYFFSLTKKTIEELQKIYDRIVNSYQNFLDNTGYYFFDMSSNNIMVNHNQTFFDYKIIRKQYLSA